MFLLSHLFGPIFYITIPLYMYVTNISRDYRVYVFSGAIAMFWAYPVLLRLIGRYRLLAFLSVQNLIFATLWASFAYGGMTSPFLPWLLISPFLAFLYLPPTGWSRNLLLGQIFGSVIAFIALCLSGYPLPHVEIDKLQPVGLLSMAAVAIYFALMSLYFVELFREQEQFALELNALVSTADNLSDLTKAANRASRAKADFVASTSHELRTPLNAIIGYSQLLLEEAVDEGNDETVADIGRIHVAGSHLLGLSDNILTYSRIDAGKMPVNPVFDTIARQVADWSAHPVLVNIADRLTIRVSDPSDAPKEADWSLIGEIVRQLVLGILKQRAGSTIELSVAIAQNEALLLRFAVRGEDGTALAVQLHSEMFEDGDDASSSKYGAMGIELPLAQKLAELLGGTILTARVNLGEPAVVLTLPSLTQPDRLAA
jgi:signal transduction histidine kinase